MWLDLGSACYVFLYRFPEAYRVQGHNAGKGLGSFSSGQLLFGAAITEEVSVETSIPRLPNGHYIRVLLIIRLLNPIILYPGKTIGPC